MNLEASIMNIGRSLVACPLNCDGIVLDPANGILPRFLILETQDRMESDGAVIIGMNPGRSSAEERRYYAGHDSSYESTVAYWKNDGIHMRPYYTRLRRFVEQLGFTGPILWTELAMCESAPGVRDLPLQTYRVCMHSFLSRELAATPDTWPIVAAGKEPYKAVAYSLPERTVIGVPHPTGSFGHFHALFDHDSLLCNVRAEACGAGVGQIKKAVWLSPDLLTEGQV